MSVKYVMKPKPQEAKAQYTVVTSDQLIQAFETLCARNQWTKAEVLELMMTKAVRDAEDLALDIHRQRIRKARGKLWENPS